MYGSWCNPSTNPTFVIIGMPPGLQCFCIYIVALLMCFFQALEKHNFSWSLFFGFSMTLAYGKASYWTIETTTLDYVMAKMSFCSYLHKNKIPKQINEQHSSISSSILWLLASSLLSLDNTYTTLQIVSTIYLLLQEYQQVCCCDFYLPSKYIMTLVYSITL